MTALQEALKDAGIVSSNYKHFDLLEHIEAELMDGELKARVLSSLAWMVDMQVINAARSVFYEAFQDNVEIKTIDAYNEFIVRCTEVKANSAHVAEVGYRDTSAWTRLCQLMAYRTIAHDAAGKCSVRRYEPKSLHELLVNEKQQAITGVGREKLKVMADQLSDGDQELAKLMFNELTIANERRFKESFDNRRKTVPAILSVIDFAVHHTKLDLMDEYSQLIFDGLTLETQQLLLEQTIRIVDRTLGDLAVNRRITVPEYAVYIREGKLLKDKLHDVLKAPKFAQIER